MTNALSKRNIPLTVSSEALNISDFPIFIPGQKLHFSILQRLLRMLFSAPFLFPMRILRPFLSTGGRRVLIKKKSALFWRKIQIVAGKSSKFLKAYLRANCGYVNSLSHDEPSSPFWRLVRVFPDRLEKKSKWDSEAGWVQCSWQDKEMPLPLSSCHWLLRLLLRYDFFFKLKFLPLLPY